MTQLALTALNPAEHLHLLEVWKFFPFQSELRYHYLYFQTEAETADLTGPNLIIRGYTGNLEQAITGIHSYLKQAKISQLCFASLSSYQLWQKALNTSSLTIYYDGKHNLADLSALPPDTGGDELRALQSLLKVRPAVLAAESADLPWVKESHIYQDYPCFRDSKTPALLLTRNSDLCAAVYSVNPAQYSIFHLQQNALYTNLGLAEQHPDFVLSTTRLQAADLQQSPAKPNSLPASLEPASGANPPSYCFFAEYYDNYMSHVNYEDWVNLMLGWYQRYAKAPLNNVLELACGTANASEILVFRGFTVDACDNSPFMLHIADAKPFKPNLYLASMLDPIPKGGYDLIFCLFDSINYLNQKTDIKLMLEHVQGALRPGGIFIFDISTLMNSLQNFNDTISYSRVKDGYIVHTSDYEVLSNKQISLLTLYRKNGACYNRFEERHVQRVYRSHELVELIEASELKLRAVYTPELSTNLYSKRNTTIDSQYARLFYILQKDR